MGLPTFNDFSLNDSVFIAERVMVKGYADRSIIRSNIGRREGIKILNVEFGEKTIEISGVVIAVSASDLQSKLDDFKKALTKKEGDLIIENGRAWKATVSNMIIPDEHYNLSKAPFSVTFVCSNPFALGSSETVVQPIISGTTVFSGLVNISGTLFARPLIEYIAPTGDSGKTLISSIVLTHAESGAELTVSGFGSGTSLDYGSTVSIDLDSFITLENGTVIESSGAFSRWEPGNNSYYLTVGQRNIGGSVRVSYRPRYL